MFKEIEVEVRALSARAVLVAQDDTETWVPKSCIFFKDLPELEGLQQFPEVMQFSVKSWFLHKEDILPLRC